MLIVYWYELFSSAWHISMKRMSKTYSLIRLSTAPLVHRTWPLQRRRHFLWTREHGHRLSLMALKLSQRESFIAERDGRVEGRTFRWPSGVQSKERCKGYQLTWPELIKTPSYARSLALLLSIYAKHASINYWITTEDWTEGKPRAHSLDWRAHKGFAYHQSPEINRSFNEERLWSP